MRKRQKTPPGYICVRVTLDSEVEERVKELAGRRYPEDVMGWDKVMADAIQWQLDRWKRYGSSPRDVFWLFTRSVPWLGRIAWGKLVEPYFKAPLG